MGKYQALGIKEKEKPELLAATDGNAIWRVKHPFTEMLVEGNLSNLEEWKNFNDPSNPKKPYPMQNRFYGTKLENVFKFHWKVVGTAKTSPFSKLLEVTKVAKIALPLDYYNVDSSHRRISAAA